MRYLLHASQREELAGRLQYLYDIFHMCFFQSKPERDFIPLSPVGPSCPDLLFITGHANNVGDFLRKEFKNIPEKTIVITSCMGQSFKKYAVNKDIYIPDLKRPVCQIIEGQPYGFDFAISDAELNFYNATGTLMERIQIAYDRL